MLALIFDTETTGLPLWKEPSDHPGQPHIIDLAVELWDGEDLVESLSCLIKPGIPIPADMTAIHGITDEMVEAEGWAKADAVNDFMKLAGKADVIVGHQVRFDLRMMRIDASRAIGTKWDNPLPVFCTAGSSMKHVRVPRADGKGIKMPTLGEAYQHFFGEEFVDAHRAKPDCEASRRIYFHLMNMEKAQ